MASTSYYGNVNGDLLAQVPATARHVLEVGCGAGQFARAYLRRNPLAVYRGVELFEEAALQAADCLDSVTQGNIESPEVLARLDAASCGQPFDTVVFGDVLEHLVDPWRVLETLAARCTPDAACIVCVPNVSHWSLLVQQLRGRWDYADAGLLDRTHLRFFTLSTLQAMLRQSGWQPVKARARKLWPKETASALQVLMPVAQALGVQAQEMEQNLSAFQWVVSAVRHAPVRPLHVAALGIRKAAGVTDVRVDQPMDMLATLPAVRVVHSAQSLTIPKDWPAGVLVLQRNFMTDPGLVSVVEAKVASGWVVVADMDDDPHHWPEFVRSDFYAYRAVHAVTASTEPLAEMIRQWNPDVQVFPNAIFALPEASTATPKQADGLRVFFGALNRQKDWGEVREGILRAFRQLGDRVEIVVVHDREFHDALPADCRKSFMPTLPHEQYMQVLASCDLALLPLADTRFNRLKSDLKFIECCAAGVVPICSPVVYDQRPEHREIGFFATDSGEWASALVGLCGDLGEVRRRRQLGLDYVRQHRMQSQQAAAREVFYRSLLDSRDRLEQQRQQRIGAMNLNK